MRNLLLVIVATFTVVTLVVGCAKSEVETPAPSTSPATSSVPVATTTPVPSPTTTTPVPATSTTVPPSPTTTSVPEQPTTSPTTGIGEAEELPVYSWDEAEYHLGETATVIGPVIEMERGQIGSCNYMYSLGVGKPVGYGSFLIALGCQESPLEDIYTGHTISVTGLIVFNGFPGEGPSGARIVLDDLSQIKIIEYHSIQISGTMEFVSWPFQDAIIHNNPDGSYTSSNNILTWLMHGDLEGTYIMDLTYAGNTNDPLPYTMSGNETFKGTLMGQPISYRADQVGSGNFTTPPPSGFEGSESWVSTIIGGDRPFFCLRGEITVNGTFDDDPELSDYTYSGYLEWYTSEKD